MRFKLTRELFISTDCIRLDLLCTVQVVCSSKPTKSLPSVLTLNPTMSSSTTPQRALSLFLEHKLRTSLTDALQLFVATGDG